MKARVKATGEVFEIASYATIPMECCDSFGNPLSFSFDEVEILSEKIESNVSDYWTRLEHQYAGMAMQGFLASGMETTDENVAEYSINQAHALVEKLKEKEKK